MTGNVVTQANLLLRKAAEDRSGLEYPLPDAIFGFHAQQAFEKLFKALITTYGAPYDFTHDLSMLLKQLRGLGEASLPLTYPIRDLQVFAVVMRYDDCDPIPERERQDIRDAIDAFQRYVVARVDALMKAQPHDAQGPAVQQ